MKRQHPILGAIRDSETNPDGVEAAILFAGRSIPVRINPDDRTMEEAIEFASSVVTALPNLEPAAKRIVVRDLCPVYNDGWNEFDEMQDDGSYKAVRNPELSDDDFASKFSLESIGITGISCIEFWYDDSNLFWGHGVLVVALDGLDLSNAEAELFG
jgi:hypothetical protein